VRLDVTASSRVGFPWICSNLRKPSNHFHELTFAMMNLRRSHCKEVTKRCRNKDCQQPPNPDGTFKLRARLLNRANVTLVTCGILAFSLDSISVNPNCL